jgi:hypothetical protein
MADDKGAFRFLLFLLTKDDGIKPILSNLSANN